MKIESFNNRTVDVVLEACQKALEAVAAEHGLRLERKRCSYHQTDMPVAFKLHVRETDSDGREITPEERDFRLHATAFGLQPDDFGKTVTIRGQEYTICGLRLRARKYPITAERGGQKYTLPEDAVLRALGRPLVSDGLQVVPFSP